MVKSRPPTEVLGRPLEATGMRPKYHVTIVAMKRKGGEWQHTTAHTVLEHDDEIMVVGAARDAERFAALR